MTLKGFVLICFICICFFSLLNLILKWYLSKVDTYMIEDERMENNPIFPKNNNINDEF